MAAHRPNRKLCTLRDVESRDVSVTFSKGATDGEMCLIFRPRLSRKPEVIRLVDIYLARVENKDLAVALKRVEVEAGILQQAVQSATECTQYHLLERDEWCGPLTIEEVRRREASLLAAVPDSLSRQERAAFRPLHHAEAGLSGEGRSSLPPLKPGGVDVQFPALTAKPVARKAKLRRPAGPAPVAELAGYP